MLLGGQPFFNSDFSCHFLPIYPSRALPRVPSTVGRSVCLCWALSKPKGPKGSNFDPQPFSSRLRAVSVFPEGKQRSGEAAAEILSRRGNGLGSYQQLLGSWFVRRRDRNVNRRKRLSAVPARLQKPSRRLSSTKGGFPSGWRRARQGRRWRRLGQVLPAAPIAGNSCSLQSAARPA